MLQTKTVKVYTSIMKKHITIKEYELPIEVQMEKEGGYTALCPIWPDCYAQGDTLEEAINELSSVSGSLIELYQEEGLTIPLKLKKSSQKTPFNLSFTFPLIVST